MEKLIKYCNRKGKLSKPRKSEVVIPYSVSKPKPENNGVRNVRSQQNSNFSFKND